MADKLKPSDFKLGMKAARLYEEIHGKGSVITDDLLSGINVWDIIAITKTPTSMDNYKAFLESDEYDNSIDIATDIVKKLWEDVTPKKD